MRYKVTITTQDITGHEETTIHEDVTNEGVINFFNSSQSKQPHKKISIQRMPEKEKVTFWFYVFEFLSYKGYSTFSNLDKDYVFQNRDEMIKRGCKCSEIHSMEVEI